MAFPDEHLVQYCLKVIHSSAPVKREKAARPRKRKADAQHKDHGASDLAGLQGLSLPDAVELQTKN